MEKIFLHNGIGWDQRLRLKPPFCNCNAAWLQYLNIAGVSFEF